MKAERILPNNYQELALELGDDIGPFNQLFEDAIQYFDSLLSQDARSSPGLERSFLDRFLDLLTSEHFLQPKNPRELLIKLSYGYYMNRQDSTDPE